MSDTLETYETDNEILFTVKFLGRIEVVRPAGLQILNEAAGVLKMSDNGPADKGKKKKSKVSLFLSTNGIDILEHKTKFMLYTCPLSTVSFCGVHQTMPSLFGFVAQHPATDMYHCYLLQSKKFSRLLVSLIGDAFNASRRNESIMGGRDLVVEALRHKNKVLLKENTELKKRLAALLGDGGWNSSTEREKSDSNNFRNQIPPETDSSGFQSEQANRNGVKFQGEDDRVPLLRNI